MILAFMGSVYANCIRSKSFTPVMANRHQFTQICTAQTLIGLLSGICNQLGKTGVIKTRFRMRFNSQLTG